MRFEVASVHGRFQPFHNGHLRYLRAAFGVSRYVLVGITQIDVKHPADVPGSGDHRSSSLSNPLTYFERSELLQATLQSQGIPESRFRITPFPLEAEHLVRQFIPTSIPVLTTVVEPWNLQKKSLLEALGYRVHILYAEDQKAVSGARVRELCATGNPAWERLVPVAAVDYLKSVEFSSRLNPAINPSERQ